MQVYTYMHIYIHTYKKTPTARACEVGKDAVTRTYTLIRLAQCSHTNIHIRHTIHTQRSYTNIHVNHTTFTYALTMRRSNLSQQRFRSSSTGMYASLVVYYIHVCIHVHIYIHTHTYTRTYTYTYVYIYIYIYFWTLCTCIFSQLRADGGSEAQAQ